MRGLMETQTRQGKVWFSGGEMRHDTVSLLQDGAASSGLLTSFSPPAPLRSAVWGPRAPGSTTCLTGAIILGIRTFQSQSQKSRHIRSERALFSAPPSIRAADQVERKETRETLDTLRAPYPTPPPRSPS
ncbi:unnamed protein product [Gadus morhua 'NCC']